MLAVTLYANDPAAPQIAVSQPITITFGPLEWWMGMRAETLMQRYPSDVLGGWMREVHSLLAMRAMRYERVYCVHCRLSRSVQEADYFAWLTQGHCRTGIPPLTQRCRRAYRQAQQLRMEDACLPRA